MLLERQRTAAFVLGAGQRLVSGQADLRIDHDLLVARQVNEHVRLEAHAVGTLETHLGVVFAAFLQTGMLQNLLQYQFAPVALGLLALQGTGQIGRFVAQTLVQLLQPLQLSGQGKRSRASC